MENRPDERADEDQREPYEPPAVVSEEVFETLASTCGKNPNQGGSCTFSQRS